MIPKNGFSSPVDNVYMNTDLSVLFAILIVTMLILFVKNAYFQKALLG